MLRPSSHTGLDQWSLSPQPPEEAGGPWVAAAVDLSDAALVLQSAPLLCQHVSAGLRLRNLELAGQLELENGVQRDDGRRDLSKE